MCGTSRNAAAIAAIAVLAAQVEHAEAEVKVTQSEDFAGALRQRAQFGASLGLEAPASFLAAADADDAAAKIAAEGALVAAKVLQQVVEQDGIVDDELVNELIRVTNGFQAATEAFEAAVKVVQAEGEAAEATVQ